MQQNLPGLRDLAPAWLDRLSSLWPEQIALVLPERGQHYTYSDLAQRARAVARGLASRGVQAGDRVATVMHNGVEMLDLLFACGYLGAILVPLNWRLSVREMGVLAEDVEPAVAVAGAEFVEMARAGLPGVPSFSLDDSLPMTYGDLLASEADLPRVDSRMSDPWLILYSGGTTGTPKGAVLTHGSIAWNAINTSVSWGLSHRDVAPNFAPMFHTGGFNVFTLPLLMLGGRVILPRRFDPAEALRLLQSERPTVCFLVPTMFQLIAEQPGFADADFSSLRWVISGGAPLPEVVFRTWHPKVQIFKQGYGLTEVGPNNFATSDEDAVRIKGASVGTLTYFARARIVDDHGQNVPDGTPGELLLAGPHMCAGYWRRPEATAAAIRDGWFYTGDVARRDREGFYYIVDRKKDMIITGGENVYPTEVEAALYAHAAVREAAVVGLADSTWGEAVWAVVSLKPDYELSAEDLRRFLRSHLAGYKVPKGVSFVDDLPKSDAGKILRKEARKLVEDR